MWHQCGVECGQGCVVNDSDYSGPPRRPPTEGGLLRALEESLYYAGMNSADASALALKAETHLRRLIRALATPATGPDEDAYAYVHETLGIRGPDGVPLTTREWEGLRRVFATPATGPDVETDDFGNVLSAHTPATGTDVPRALIASLVSFALAGPSSEAATAERDRVVTEARRILATPATGLDVERCTCSDLNPNTAPSLHHPGCPRYDHGWHPGHDWEPPVKGERE